MWVYDFLRSVTRLAFKLLARIEVEGLKNVPSSGPFILVINHVHFLDPPLIVATIPRYISVLAASKWQHKPPGLLLTAVNAIYVKRGEVDRVALRKCIEVLKQGGVLGMAPEGTRSHTPGMQPARPGVAYVASRADVPILPIGLVGVHEVFMGLRQLRRACVQVNIGPTFKVPSIDKSRSRRRVQLREASDQIMRHLAELLPPEYQGVYQQNASSEEHQSTEDPSNTVGTGESHSVGLGL